MWYQWYFTFLTTHTDFLSHVLTIFNVHRHFHGLTQAFIHYIQTLMSCYAGNKLCHNFLEESDGAGDILIGLTLASAGASIYLIIYNKKIRHTYVFFSPKLILGPFTCRHPRAFPYTLILFFINTNVSSTSVYI